ncbi:ATP-binding cassette-type vacuolar membrane transporter Hmt1, variant 3 [Entomophthora muscae]|uniref:ATP-binding cassette-type vacuolar membrane transporter Hmt1, variant 3 n=1 Tax=Entomophthora muscae TaxID=34485 RepID=A0ACC2TJJ1_9FUNG|nr:ATP-binding cassette-type vacuolar membrane transporter Hmt1, variant 3 [Entomophthora muscae]
MRPNLEKYLQCESNEGNLYNTCIPSVLLPAALLNLMLISSLIRFWRLWRNAPYSFNPSRNSESTPLLGSAQSEPQPRSISISPFLISNGAVIAILLLELMVVIARALIDSVWSSTIYTLYLLVTLVAWCACAVILIVEFYAFGSVDKAWVAYWYGALSFPTEFLMLIRWLTAIKGDLKMDRWELTLLILFLVRDAFVSSFAGLSVVWLFRTGCGLHTVGYRVVPQDEESGRVPEAPATPPKKTLVQQFKKVLPYMWARDNTKLQIYVGLAFGLLLAGRIIGPMTPFQYKVIVDALSYAESNPDSQISGALWRAVLVYGILRLLQGGNGLISSAQSWVLIPINQFTTRKVSIDMFSHLHDLSLDFHIKRKTGEILRVMDRGTSSVVSLMNYVVFSIFPTIADILIAVVLLYFYFDITYSMIVFVAMGLYMWATISITEWRTKFRRAMNEYNNNVNGIAVDSLLNFETVKYFGAENFEVTRYDNAMQEYLRADLKNSASLPILNLVQNFILTLALLAGSLLCSYEVTTGTKKVGDFILFNSYLLQISVPLNFFGTLYRMIQQNFIDMEKMLELLEVNQSVSDHYAAAPLASPQGEVVFDHVCFSYTKDSSTLEDLSFTVPSGKTVALVGPSGGGKSTILKLLFRFYDVDSGAIRIDGQDISKLTQSSLRKAIGVVPQDTVLFNDTIRYNIRYGNPNASDWEVEYAAKMAQIHERILSFPQGYDTIVGERGLRLSGGEKQRVAIARTFLKDPKIVLLDEATSALDTATERQIQESFNLITENRTTLVIAHRLSTVVNADIILW